MKELLQLYWAFFKIGGLTFGGGLTMLPMLTYELVDKNHWVSEDELLDCYAIGQCTPGIIAINTATYVGFKKRGVIGGIFSTLGMASPSLLIITIIAAFLENFMDNIWLNHALMGVRGVVCALMLNTVITLAKKSLVDIPCIILCAIAFCISLIAGIPTILIIITAAICGILIQTIKSKKTLQKSAQDEEVNS